MLLSLLLACLHAPPAPPDVVVETSWLVDVSATELRRQLDAGDLTEAVLRTATVERIEAMNRRGPMLRSVIFVDATAVGGTGSLAGLPLLLKDNIDVAGQPTTAGSRALADHVAANDAFLVVGLREAGAVLLGKANLSEWANFRGQNSISGWSGVGGQVRNPHALDRTPCGSSSGSAAAVAAGLAALAVGTETDGSILCPASMNGIVGLKPTLGLVSRDGIVPLAPSQDTAGPMARTVADAALLLGAMVGSDPSDPEVADRPEDLDTDYVAALSDTALEGARIGVARSLGSFGPRVEALFDEALADLEAQGAILVEIDFAGAEASGELEFEVLFHEFAPAMDAYLASVDPSVGIGSLADLVAYNEAHSDELRLFGQENFKDSLEHDRDDDYSAIRADLRRLAGPEGLGAALKADELDAIVAPTTGPAFLIDGVNGDVSWTGSSYSTSAQAGWPSLTVPMGAVSGLPVGLSFYGGPWTEARLLALAYDFEQAKPRRVVPSLRPTVPTDLGPASPH